MPPPYGHIDLPIPHDDWKNNTLAVAPEGRLFTAGAQPTWTRVCAASLEQPWPKYAYGYTKTNGGSREFWFFISLNKDQRSSFIEAHNAWVHSNQLETESEAETRIRHSYIEREQPDNCGTPNTTSCPPDPLLGGAMRYLRDVMAGAGAAEAALQVAATKVEKFVVSKIAAEIDKLAPNPALAPLSFTVHEAIEYLRHLKVGQSLKPDAATLDQATLEIEVLLAKALKAEATRRLIGPAKLLIKP